MGSQCQKVVLYYETEDAGDGVSYFCRVEQASARFANYLEVGREWARANRVRFVYRATQETAYCYGRRLAHGAVINRLFTAFGSGAIEYRPETGAAPN